MLMFCVGTLMTTPFRSACQLALVVPGKRNQNNAVLGYWLKLNLGYILKTEIVKRCSNEHF